MAAGAPANLSPALAGLNAQLEVRLKSLQPAQKADDTIQQTLEQDVNQDIQRLFGAFGGGGGGR